MLLTLAGLALGLVLVVPWPTGIGADELDFGDNGEAKSGGGEFSKYVPRDSRALIGKIPVGIKDLSIQLTASSDLDIELWDGDVFVVGWEADGGKALLYGETETTGEYNGVDITWSGWNGDGTAPGNESITLSGTTKNTFSGLINMFDSLLDNRGTVENTGTIEVFHFGPYQNLGGLLDTKLGGAFTNAGSTINLADGVINNAGSIINDRNLVNAGTMNNLCSGTVDGPVSGNQPVVVCSIK